MPRDIPRACRILEAVVESTQDSDAIVALGWHHMTFGVAEDYVDAVNCFIEGMDDVNPEGTFGYGCAARLCCIDGSLRCEAV
jgi:hypothetical protein